MQQLIEFRNYYHYSVGSFFYFMKVGENMIFKANGNIWLLKFVRPSDRNLQRSDGVYTLGVTDGNLKTVFIADNLNDYMTDKVFLHELTHVHAIENNYYMPIETEEIVADFLSLFGRDIVYLADDIMGKLMRRIA